MFLASSLWGNIAFLALAAIFQLKKISIDDFRTNLFKIILIIIVLSLVNYVFSLVINGGTFINNSNAAYPYAFSMIFAYILAATITEKNLKWLLFFILIDAMVGVAEYTCGVKSFWNVTNDTFEESSELLYFRRSAGINNSSSILGLKIVIGLCIIYILRPKYKIIYLSILLAGLFCSFNRTYILASFPLWIYFGYERYKQLGFKAKLVVICGVSICGMYILISIMPVIEEQFFRGNSSLSGGALSHRDEIWHQFMSFYKSHPISGNGSVKMLLPNGWHAHNSFIWVLASNGIVIASLYYLYLIAFLNKKILVPMVSLILGSITQCSIYWGLSLCDIFVFYLILNRHRTNLCANSESLSRGRCIRTINGTLKF